MRYLITLTMAAAIFGLTACSKSGGEDKPFFPPALTGVVFNQCRSGNARTPRTPENQQPVPIFNSSFVRSTNSGTINDGVDETGSPDTSKFFDNCLVDAADSVTVSSAATILPPLNN